ncbi:F-box domain containing protein [Pandoravirus neocaledonia]|uniref:F-box domain containing protein n=1 Tax=Pandoravirus neocaledonia TaxID=2107708 RepID=A0A2U7UD35_9VIRU|nr:F-box domain containing protein [Pandoravirus neocaledonia]AVK76378.1 F-box domain containing protein [Pandoravirus neocaledonia]
MEAKATIATLPPEVLDLIFFSHADFVDRAIIGRVCRQWRSIGRCRWRRKQHRYERPTWIDIVGACCDGRETVARWLVDESAHWHCPLGPADGWACVEALRRRNPDLVPWLRNHDARWSAYTRAKALSKGYMGAIEEGTADGLVMSQTDVDAVAASGDLLFLQRLAVPPLCDYGDLLGVAVSAARAGHLSVLEWLAHEHAFRFPTACVYAAAMKGHTAIVRWLARIGVPMAADVAVLMDESTLPVAFVNHWVQRLDAHTREIVSVIAIHGRRCMLDRMIDALPAENRRVRATVCEGAVRHLPKCEVMAFLMGLADRFGTERVVSWLPPSTVGRAIERDLCEVVTWMIDLGCGWPLPKRRSRDSRRPPGNLVAWAMIDAIDGVDARMSLFSRALAGGWRPRPNALRRSLCAMEHTRTQNSTRTEPCEIVVRALIQCGHCAWTDKARRLALCVCSTETALLALTDLAAGDATAHIESIRITHPHRYAALVARLGASSNP